MKQALRTMFAAAALCAILTTGIFAAAESMEYCFAQSDFLETSAELDGIFLARVPEGRSGTLYLGQRALREGDAIPAELLDSLVLRAQGSGTEDAVLVFHAVTDGHVADPMELKVSLAGSKNQPPEAEDSVLETYKNIANSGTLKVTDPEGGKLTYALVREPKRGTVDFREDGTFTYTPVKNKVGKDSFTYTATDDAGNVSREAEVRVTILKPTDRITYADMSGEEGEFYAAWLRQEGLFTGETVAGNLCFGPEKTVSRGEFLAMTMKLLDTEKSDASLTSGFADEAETPVWMQGYISTALKSGMISGVNSESGMVFRPLLNMTRAEAVVMLQNVLHLKQNDDAMVFSPESDVPVWARSSWAALSCAGIELEDAFSAESITRKEAAALLYQVAKLLESDADLRLPK